MSSIVGVAGSGDPDEEYPFDLNPDPREWEEVFEDQEGVGDAQFES